MKSTDVIPLSRDAAQKFRASKQEREGMPARPGLALAAVVLSSRSGIAPEAARSHLSAILEGLALPPAG